MRKKVIYECSVCGATADRLSPIRYCEASHLGVTPERVDQWVDLIHCNMHTIEMSYSSRNTEFESKWAEMAQKTQTQLSEFEERYNLKGKKVPEHWESFSDEVSAYV